MHEWLEIIAKKFYMTRKKKHAQQHWIVAHTHPTQYLHQMPSKESPSSCVCIIGHNHCSNYQAGHCIYQTTHQVTYKKKGSFL
jgi:hypothetical protein